MNIVVPIKMVPDLVEELTIDASGAALDTTWLRLMINESDDHAIEQAILLKERFGGTVTVIAAEAEGLDDVLFTAAAKGADRLIKLTGDFSGGMNNHALGRALAAAIQELAPSLVLTGVQAHNDLDGQIGPLLAGYLGLPYTGYVAGVTINDSQAVVRKEYPGGLIAEMRLSLPAVLGIQVAEQPPRYVAISKVRLAMKSAVIEERALGELDLSGGPSVDRMYQPKSGSHAEIIAGGAEEIAAKLVEIFKRAGVL